MSEEGEEIEIVKDKELVKEKPSKKIVNLELGDIIRIEADNNEEYNGHTFYINYIDDKKIKLINTKSLHPSVLNVEDDILLDKSITTISLLYRNKNKGYVLQHHLITGTWINILFAEDVPLLITGEITNVEEDMIELTTYPKREIIYINFEYKGIPEDLPIEYIHIRKEPGKEGRELAKPLAELEKISEESLEEGEEGEEYDEWLHREGPIEKEYFQQEPDIIKLNEYLLKADQIVFGEQLEEIAQYVNVDASKQRYNIDTQTNDLLDNMISKLSVSAKTTDMINNIHIMIERYKQLRQDFSIYDEYGNVNSYIQKSILWKPLVYNLERYKQMLYWIIPVATNNKKIYNDTELLTNLKEIEQIIYTYQHTDEQNKYVKMIQQLNPYFSPFDELNTANTITDISILDNLTVLINNTDNFETNTFDNVKKFYMDTYNTGLTKVTPVTITNSKYTVELNELTEPYILSLKSIITLPEPVIKFSHINLPGTNLLDKANLNLSFISYFKILNAKTKVQTIQIDDLSTNIEFNKVNYADNIKNYTLAKTAEMNKLLPEELYKQFLNIIIPKTRVLFKLMDKYINGKLSLYNVTQYLEPFLIYVDDLTYTQYKDINLYIKTKMSEFNVKTWGNNSKSRDYQGLGVFLNKLQESVKPSYTPIFNFIIYATGNADAHFNREYNIEVKQNVIAGYKYDHIKNNKTTAELIKQITINDFGELYNTGLSILQIDLMLPENIHKYLENNKDILDDEIQDQMHLDHGVGEEKDSDLKEQQEFKKCDTYIIAKQYMNLKELEDDNNKQIYFDKQFDKTPYQILDDFDKELSTKSVEEFYPFFVNKLVEKYKYSQNEAPILAEYILNKARPVQEDEYAIFYDNDKLNYYKRKNNVWKKSEIDAIGNETELLCDMKQSCISITDKQMMDAGCESMALNKKEIKKKILNQVINEFDKNYIVSKANLEQHLSNKFKYYNSIMPNLIKIKKNQQYKYNNIQYKLGLEHDEDAEAILISPYFKLRDLILGQSDFIKKQNDILDFYNKFTRDANATGEDNYWLYCKSTNAKLLPTFIVELAYAFVNNPQDYIVELNLIIKTQGQLSDDGDSIIDKHSGYVIRKIDFDEEEGFDESGFKISSRAILEEDANITLTGSSNTTDDLIKKLSPEVKTITNIINAISGFMYININIVIREFIIQITTRAIANNMMKKKEYQKLVELNAKKGKKTTDYNVMYNSFVLYLTMGSLLIGIQTSIPSIKTRKTHPGCVKSFQGFPFTGSGDDSALQYISCIANKIKNSSMPWQVLKKEKEDTITAKLKIYINDYLMVDPDVTDHIKMKNEYLLTDAEIIIPDEHNINKWTSFLPPLKEFTIKPRALQNITTEFKQSLMRSLKTESLEEAQREKILIIESKIILFSLGIQEKIQKIVQQKILLMTNMAGVPFLENYCCDENNKSEKAITIKYFIDEDREIYAYNHIVQDLSNILEDIDVLTKAVYLTSNKNTKQVFPPLSTSYEEVTIYKTFINVCKFNSLVPLNPELLVLCQEKPNYLLVGDTIIEKIHKLKQNGIIYTNENFLELLKIKDRENIVTIPEQYSIKLVDRIKDILDHIHDNPTHIISQELTVLLQKLVEPKHKHKHKSTEKNVDEDITEIEDVKNYLIETNDDLKIKVYEFIIANFELTKSKKSILKNTIENICEWDTINEESINFIKNCITNLFTVYPTIILNKIDYSSFKMPAYFGLSQFHSNDIKIIVNDFYKTLIKYYDDPILVNILSEMISNSTNLLLLIKEIPYDRLEHGIFSKSMNVLLFEYFFLNTFMEYIKLIDMPDMLSRDSRGSRSEEDTFTSEFVEESDLRLYAENEAILLGGKKKLKITVANLLTDYLNIISTHKNIINLSSESITDIVFKIRQKEKDTFTDRLKAMSVEGKDVDTMMKINKLGDWSKGLQKGLTIYDKDTYDADRDEMEKLVNIENKLLRQKQGEAIDDLDRMDYMENEQRENEIDAEDNDLTNLNDNYDEEYGNGDEQEEADVIED